jgi:hypothetical protein
MLDGRVEMLGAVPTPKIENVFTGTGVFEVTATIALKSPAVAGVNVATTLQDVPGASVSMQLPEEVRAKSVLESWVLLIIKGAFPQFVMVNELCPEEPTCALPYVAFEKQIAGPGWLASIKAAKPNGLVGFPEGGVTALR